MQRLLTMALTLSAFAFALTENVLATATDPNIMMCYQKAVNTDCIMTMADGSTIPGHCKQLSTNPPGVFSCAQHN